MKFKIVIKFYFLFALIFLVGCKEIRSREFKIIQIGEEKIEVEIADTPEEWEIGLAYRDTLPEDKGMLFVFPTLERRVFWMRGCKFDIDLAYIEPNGVISEIITMKKESPFTPLDSLKRYPSKSSKIKFAIEMIGGWFKRHDIKPGDKINFKDYKPNF
ncbi:MAG: DUF192 domain-containing protein [candidate division WOR-3 bacterium]